jgi:hypothetical protein
MYEFIETKRSGVGPGPERDIPPAGKQHFSNSARDFFLMAARKDCATERIAMISSGGDVGWIWPFSDEMEWVLNVIVYVQFFCSVEE